MASGFPQPIELRRAGGRLVEGVRVVAAPPSDALIAAQAVAAVVRLGVDRIPRRVPEVLVDDVSSSARLPMTVV